MCSALTEDVAPIKNTTLPTESWEPGGENDSTCLVGRLEDDLKGRQMQTEKRSESGGNLSVFMLVGFSRRINQREHTGERSYQRNTTGRRHTLEGCMSTRLREGVRSRERQSPGRKLRDPHPQQGWGGPHRPRPDLGYLTRVEAGRQGKRRVLPVEENNH